MPDVVVNGARYHFDDTGGGPEAVVFGHGLLWSGAMFAPQVEALRGRYRCVTFDFRGQGRSEVTERGYGMDALYDDVSKLVDHLGLERFHYVGLSMGGFIGLRFALRQPARLRSLTLLDSAGDAEPWANRPKYRAMALVARALGFKPLLGPISKIMLGASTLADRPRTAALQAELAKVDILGATRATIGVVERPSLMAELGRTSTPTLVLHGEEDRAIVPARARATAARIPGAQVVLVPRAGHSSSLENPEGVTAALRDFLAAHAD